MTDPYMNTEVCVNRLYREWSKHKRLIVACDFDDTVFAYHNPDDTHHHVFNLLEQCQRAGFYIVLWTASAPDRYTMMQEYMRNRGIAVHSINTNPVELPFGNNGKIYYNILLDDRAGLGQAYDTLKGVLERIRGDNDLRV